MEVRVDRLGKSFEAQRALEGVSFSGSGSEIIALCGENGAGKSTLINILSGACRPDTGSLFLDDLETVLPSPRAAISLGIRTVHQELSLLPHLSAAENILLGQMPTGALGCLIDWRRARARAAAVLDDFGFPDIDVTRPVALLAVSVQQVIEIAKAIVVPPRMLILDEPTAVLSSLESDLLFRKVRQLAASGTFVLYVSHRLPEIFALAHRVIVLRDGMLTLAAPIDAVDEASLIKAMVGRSINAIYPPRGTGPAKPETSRPLLEIRNFRRGRQYTDVSLSVRAGEIVGLFGLVGSGRTELARGIFGADPRDVGEILLDGVPVRLRTPHDAVAHGVAFVTEDRKRDGLALDCSACDNASLATLSRDGRFGFISPARQRRRVETCLRRLKIRPLDLTLRVRRFSGGNQQKVVLAKWLLSTEIRLFIFDEPTRGVDIGAKVEIYRLIDELARRGAAVLIISSELPEALGMSDRLLVMRTGRIVAELTRDEYSMETVFEHAAGIAHHQPQFGGVA
jgi:ABC-type sugar transport system ATPase subunit